MDVGQAIALAGGLAGLVATLWKVFNVIRQLEKQIDKVANEQEVQELTINGVRERSEHTRERLLSELAITRDRLNCVENWLNKHTEFESHPRR